MRFSAFCILLALSSGGTAQQKTEYPALKQRFQHGNYTEAKAGYEELIRTEKSPIAAFIGLADCYRAEGEYVEALETIEKGLKSVPDNVDLLAQRADLLFSVGKWDDAEKDSAAALKQEETNFLARWVRVRLLRDKGDIPAADKEVRWFVKAYTNASNAGKDISDAQLLCIIGQAGTENARWNHKPQQFSFILNEVYKDALKHDPDCWQAENLAGRLLWEKHNAADAADAFDNALKINPKAVEALVGKGMLPGIPRHYGSRPTSDWLREIPQPRSDCFSRRNSSIAATNERWPGLPRSITWRANRKHSMAS
jgi:cellulose synthase operon protein C